MSMLTSRRNRPAKPRPVDWLTETEYAGHFRGEEFTFLDHDEQMCRARLIEYVVSPKGDWITCIEVSSKDGQVRGGVRSIDPSRVRRWWKKKKTAPTPKQKRALRAPDSPEDAALSPAR